jgi:hypothetical protein
LHGGLAGRADDHPHSINFWPSGACAKRVEQLGLPQAQLLRSTIGLVALTTWWAAEVTAGSRHQSPAGRAPRRSLPGRHLAREAQLAVDSQVGGTPGSTSPTRFMGRR